jgi:hypothetical protein
LSDQYRDTVATIVKEEAVRGRVKLEQLRVSYNERLEKLRPQAQMLATLVGCGADSQCSLRIENPRKNLATGLSYQILKNESSIAPFVSTVSVLGLMRAVARHLEINPHDRELIEAQRSNLEAAMSQVDVELFQQVGVIQFDFDSEINRRIRKFRKDNSKLFRGFFSQEERLGLIDYLAELKTTMKRFKTFEIGTQIETKLWDTLATNYSLALERASRMSVQAQLPTQQIVVSWDDEPAQRYLVNVAWPNMVSGYLLGDNAQDVRQWVDFLSL